MFNKLQHTITGWPGGNPNVEDANRLERATQEKKIINMSVDISKPQIGELKI